MIAKMKILIILTFLFQTFNVFATEIRGVKIDLNLFPEREYAFEEQLMKANHELFDAVIVYKSIVNTNSCTGEAWFYEYLLSPHTVFDIKKGAHGAISNIKNLEGISDFQTSYSSELLSGYPAISGSFTSTRYHKKLFGSNVVFRIDHRVIQVLLLCSSQKNNIQELTKKAKSIILNTRVEQNN
ncbi:hypothetical protein ACNUDM_20735 [Vibrio chaetopteri]|uniref:hypothetical protein n=1 Tax=Vibrio chaetopteri TaxID=3016528 RepID=UPI003AB6C31E